MTICQVPTHFDNNQILRQKGRLLKEIQAMPIKQQLWAAGFSFSDSTVFVNKIPYDPQLQDIFFGEEISMAVRSAALKQI